MTPAECQPGALVQIRNAPGRIWEVQIVEGNWVELLHVNTGARCQITVSSLVPADHDDALPQPETCQEMHRSAPSGPRRPSPFCWFAISMAVTFVALHVWAAIRIGQGAAGLDPIGGAVAIASGGLGWAAWFATLLWMTWRRR